MDTTVHAIHIKTKLCQLVETMMARRDDLAFRQEMKFRNKLVEYLTDWVMGNSHQIAPPSSGDVSSITRYAYLKNQIVVLFTEESNFIFFLGIWIKHVWMQ